MDCSTNLLHHWTRNLNQTFVYETYAKNHGTGTNFARENSNFARENFARENSKRSSNCAIKKRSSDYVEIEIQAYRSHQVVATRHTIELVLPLVLVAVAKAVVVAVAKEVVAVVVAVAKAVVVAVAKEVVVVVVVVVAVVVNVEVVVKLEVELVVRLPLLNGGRASPTWRREVRSSSLDSLLVRSTKQIRKWCHQGETCHPTELQRNCEYSTSVTEKRPLLKCVRY